MTLVSTTHPPGVYELYSFRAVDVNGFNGNWTPSNSSAVTVTNNSGADFVGPSISNLVVSPTNVNITTTPQSIAISFRATDTSGVNTSTINRPCISNGNNTFCFDRPILISGNNKDGTYQTSMTLASTTHPPGVYELYSFRAVDINGINEVIGHQVLSAVTVTNNSGADFVGPSISDLKILPFSANNNGGFISISSRATDTSGLTPQ